MTTLDYEAKAQEMLAQHKNELGYRSLHERIATALSQAHAAGYREGVEASADAAECVGIEHDRRGDPAMGVGAYRSATAIRALLPKDDHAKDSTNSKK